MDSLGASQVLARRMRIERQWHSDECPEGCSYAADRVPHDHERHDDGSRAVIGTDASGLWELLEFSGSLGF